MPVNESVFALFFAIFWGGVMNVSGRWRMFQPLVCDWRILNRFALSLVMMVLLPIFYFALQLRCVGAGPDASTSTLATFAAVLPSLGVFIFYRSWMAIVEWRPHWFYWSREESPSDHRIMRVDPSMERLTLRHGFGYWWNAGAAIFYGVLAVGLPWLLRGT